MTTKKKTPPFRGIGTALVTPFCDGRVDLACFRRTVARQIAGGVSALVVAGTTGEAVTLRGSERAALLAAAVEESAGRLPVIAGTGCADTRAAVAASRYAASHGADALLVVTPYYNKGTREGIVTHYLTIAEAVDVPIILYNVPSRTGVDLSPALLSELAEHENIVAIKEASGSIDRCADLVAAFGDQLLLYSGNDGELLPTLAVGGIGLISVISNLLPEETAAIYRLFTEGHTGEAAALASRLLPLCRAMFAEVNPAPIKYAMACRGLIRPEARLPLTMPGTEVRARIEQLLAEQ